MTLECNRVSKIKEGDRFGHLVATGNYMTIQKGGQTRGKNEFICDCGVKLYMISTRVKQRTYPRKNCLSADCIYSKQGTHRHSVGGKKSKEYIAWTAMKYRCSYKNHPLYKNYGGRGITVCKEFDSFDVFLDHIGLAPSQKHGINRMNNDGNYEIGNVRWATKKEQTCNRRSKVSRDIFIKDIKLYPNDLVKDRAIRLNVSINAIYGYLKKL